MEPTTPRPKLTREQALEKYGDVSCVLTEFHKGDLVFEGEAVRTIRLYSTTAGDTYATVRLTLRAGDYDIPFTSYGPSNRVTMRKNEDRFHVRILEMVVGREEDEVVYEAEPQGVDYEAEPRGVEFAVEFAVDDEDPDGEP